MIFNVEFVDVDTGRLLVMAGVLIQEALTEISHGRLARHTCVSQSVDVNAKADFSEQALRLPASGFDSPR